jgi:hypothetical protein
MTTRRIHSKGPFTHEEYNAGEAGIYPGMLLKIDSNNEVVKNDAEGMAAEAIFAAEDALQGGAVRDVYTDGEPVTCILPGKGCEVFALIANGEDISTGDELISNGEGRLIAKTNADSAADGTVALAVACEDCDASGSDPDDEFCRVRII